MNNKKTKVIEIIFKYGLRLIILNLLSVLSWWLFYKFSLKLDEISNSIFIVNISVFFITLIMHLGATRLLIPLNYTAKSMFRYKALKEKYDDYNQYYEENAPTHKKAMLHWIIPSIIMIIVALILAVLY